MAMRSKILMAGAALGALVMASGCAPVDPGFGNSVAQAKAAHTVNPDPVYGEDDAKPGDNAEVGAAAVERYREGNVTPAESPGVQGGPG